MLSAPILPGPSLAVLILPGLLLISCLLAACGNRGPLYLPDEPYVPATSQDAMQDSTSQVPEPGSDNPVQEASAEAAPDRGASDQDSASE